MEDNGLYNAHRKQFHEFQELWENKLPQMGVDRKEFYNAYDNLELLDLDKGKKMTVFNKNNIDFTKQKLFFGEPLNTQRFDEFKYPIFDKLTQTQLGFFWRPEEVSLQKDRSDYATLNDAQKHIFTSNLRYQTLLDSVQGRKPPP